MSIQIKHMWEGGPLRQVSRTRPEKGKWIKLAGGSYAGSYVCERCRRSVDGVYRAVEPQKWVCGPCKDALKTAASASIWKVA